MGLLDRLRQLIAGGPPVEVGRSPFLLGQGPSRLVVLRHAEKTGDKNDPHLSPPGRQRAERLVTYIPATFGRPDFLIAARTSKRSRRPVETLEPLAGALALEIDAALDDSEVDALVAALGREPRYFGKAGVISWRHSDIPRLVTALGAPLGTVATHWDERDYRTIVDIAYSPNGRVAARRLEMPW